MYSSESLPNLPWQEARHLLRHQHLDGGQVFPDAMAHALLAREAQAVLREPDNLQEQKARQFIALLHSIAEDRLARAVRGGTRQLVILGARLTTLGLRNPHGQAGLQTFEIHPPAILTWKAERIAAEGLATPPNLHLVPCNIQTDGLLPRLEAEGFNPLRPAFFLALGVLPFLTWEMNDALLRFVSSLPRGEILYDYYEPLEKLEVDTRGHAETLRAALTTNGEAVRLDFTQRQMEDLLELTNFRWFENFGASDLDMQSAPGARIVHARA